MSGQSETAKGIISSPSNVKNSLNKLQISPNSVSNPQRKYKYKIPPLLVR
jgi:hypothetical protein